MVLKRGLSPEPAPDCSKLKPSCGQGCRGTPCITGIGLLPWPRSSHQQAQQCPISFSSHCSIVMPPWHVNTARRMLIRKLAECFHHKWLLRFKYCVCLYLAARDPTKDRALKHQKGAGWEEGHLSAELTKGSDALSVVSHIYPVLAAKNTMRYRPEGDHALCQREWSSLPHPNTALGTGDAGRRDFCPQAVLLCLLPLGTAKLLMASLPLWSKRDGTLRNTGSKSTHHGKRNKTGQRLAACLIQLLSCIH